MSIVTGIMLIVSVCEEDDPALERVLQWRKTGGWLKPVEDHAGGNKHPQFLAFAAGMNMFDEDEFAAFVMAQPWELPENVVLILQPEEGRTRVFRPGDRKPDVIIEMDK